MATQSYLIFSLRNVRYSIDAMLVKEIFSLPELIPIPETPIDIVGLLNLRGMLIPVMHLDKRLGHPLQPFCISDSIVVVEWQGLQVGMIVQQVQEVREIDPTQIIKELDFGRVSDINTAFVAGVVQIEGESIVLLNPETLIRQPEEVASLILESGSIAPLQSEPPDTDFTDWFSSEAGLSLEPTLDLWEGEASDAEEKSTEPPQPQTLQPPEQGTPPNHN